MTIRVLEVEAWGKLEGHPIFKTTGLPSPDNTRILIAESEEGQIVGLWCMVQVIHCEPVWIDPFYRNSTLAGRMWRKMKVLIDHLHLNVAFVFSDRPEIADYLKRLGLKKLPYETFLFDPKGKYPND